MNSIKEKTRQFAKDKVGDYDYLGNEYEAYLDGAKDVTDYIMSLPLCDRLTSEGREKIKELYSNLNNAYHSPMTSKGVSLGAHIAECANLGMALNKMKMLESIFGTAMLEEKGGEI